VKRLVALALLAFVACAGKLCDDSYLAELSSYQGDVQRDQARAIGSWSEVSRGDRFRVGDGLRTGTRGSAELSLSSDGVALVEANTVLRFLDRDPREGDRRLSLEQGVVRVEAGGDELDVRTPGAHARVAENSTVRIVALDRDVRFDVLVGRVAIQDDSGKHELLAGQTQTSGTAAASVAQAKDASSAQVVDSATAAVAAPAAEAAAELAASGHADLALPTLESMTLHAPSLPLNARVQAPPCDGPLALTVAGRTLAPEPGSATVLVRLSAGSHAFRILCAKRVVQQGTLRVQRDLATMELPNSAQRLDIEPDGRRYTVRYQNVLPVVTVRWRGARPAASYTLHLRRGKRERSFRGDKPEQAVPAAALSEGDHDFWFTSARGQRSEESGLRIEFDNTARSLSLSSPIDGSAREGPQTLVSGVALLRSQVSANGVPLPLDAKGRFNSQVPLDQDGSVLVRATHPAAGVHYYVRRLR
jgi:hypothetical protein